MAQTKYIITKKKKRYIAAEGFDDLSVSIGPSTSPEPGKKKYVEVNANINAMIIDPTSFLFFFFLISF